MFKKLKLDKKFLPCPVEAGDELYPNGIFVFNITKLCEFILANPVSFPIEKVLLTSLRNSFSTNLNELTIQNADLGKPIILAEIAPGQFNVIDGNHRHEKASREGLETILAYRSYISYWNSKVHNIAEKEKYQGKKGGPHQISR
jgi:hypothetical protein